MNHRRSPVAEKDKDHKDDQQDRRTYREDHVADGFTHGIRRIECDVSGHAGRKALRQPIQFRDGPPIDIERVGGGELRDAYPDRFLSVELQIRAVAFRPQLGPSHILQADQSSVGVGLENDVVELAGFAEPAHGAHADLVLLSFSGGLLTNLSGRHFDVLFRKCVDHVRCRQPTSRHAPGIQPQAHGVLALSEDENIGDSGNALQSVLDVDIKVVAHEKGGVLAVIGDYGGAEYKV